jgi:hypothetical protein
MEEDTKASALYKDLEWIALMEYNRVIFEMDCKMTLVVVHNNKSNRFEYDSLIYNG